MRINFDHPVIVSGRWENGRPRHDLVRTTSEFEIETYASDDVPVCLTYAGNETCRAVNGRLFNRSPIIEHHPAAPFESSSLGIHTLLFAGGIEGFDPIWKMVKNAADVVKAESDYRSVENLERTPLQKELRSGHNKRSIACLKAPALKNWKWLSTDTEAEVALWKDKIGELLSNVILVDGTPYVRTAEPRLELSKSASPSASVVLPGARPLYTRLAYKTEHEPSGLVSMPDEAFKLGSHFFGLGEADKLFALADDLGWRVMNDLRDLEIIDETALTVDHLEMEQARHARLALDRAVKMALIHMGQANAAGRPHHAAYATIQEAIETHHAAIIGWQSRRTGIEEVSLTYASLVEEIAAFPLSQNEIRRPGEFNLMTQFETFETRLDSEPVFLSQIAPVR